MRGPPRPRAWLLLPAFLVILAIAHTLTWRWAEQQLESGFAEWQGQRRALGWTITHGATQRAGWPLQAELLIPDLEMSGGRPDIPDGLSWSAGRVVLQVSLLHPHLLRIGLDGQQRLALGADAPIPFTADLAEISLKLEPGVPPRAADIAIDHLRAGLATGALTLARLRLHGETKPAATQGEPALSFGFTVGDVALPPPGEGLTWPLGPRLASLTLSGVLSGPVPRSPTLYARAIGWRDGGGTLELQQVALGWGPLGLTGSATLALDERMQPMGAATARIVGPSETLDALAAAHAIGTRVAVAAKAVLGLIERRPEGGGAPEVEVPLTLQDRALTVGRIPLARIPLMVWPDAP